MTTDPKPLTPKQEMFCKEYIIDFNATRAAKAAGYSHKSAYTIGQKLTKKNEIQKRLIEEVDKRKDRVEIDQDYVLGVIHETVELSRQKTLVTAVRLAPNDDGVNVPELHHLPMQMDSGAVLRGTDQLGRHLAMFTDNHNVAGVMALAKSPDLVAADVAKNQLAGLEKPEGARE